MGRLFFFQAFFKNIKQNNKNNIRILLIEGNKGTWITRENIRQFQNYFFFNFIKIPVAKIIRKILQFYFKSRKKNIC